MLLNLKKLKEKYNLNIKGVLHIGAHFGQEYSTYEDMNINDVMFFEPLPHTFEMLKKNVGDKAILVNTALGNTVGTINMNVEFNNQGQSSSILEPSIHLRQYPHIKFEDVVEVNITKLDTFMFFKII